jgi:type IV secretory pathway VirB3-like protein
MDLDLADTVEIPSGAVQTRTLLGVPTEVALLMLCLAAIPFLAFRSLWTLLLLPPLWGFLKFQSLRDPAFLRIWAGQMQFAAYYHG